MKGFVISENSDLGSTTYLSGLDMRQCLRVNFMASKEDTGAPTYRQMQGRRQVLGTKSAFCLYSNNEIKIRPSPFLKEPPV